ncbi:MAG: metallophosphoesterase family protein [Treponemataceae bacterium]
MRLLLISDLHANIDMINALDDEFAKADIVLCAGDFAQFNHVESSIPTLKTLAEKHDTIFAVTGNCDSPEFVHTLENHGMSVQNDLTFHNGLFFAGAGGALQFTNETPNERTEEQIIGDLRILKENKTQIGELSNLILILHQPPKNTNLDKTSTGMHVGSEKLRTFIETHQPLAVICGHIHEAVSTDTIGTTFLVNPGSLAEQNYALLTLQKTPSQWIVKSCDLCTLKTPIKQ